MLDEIVRTRMAFDGDGEPFNPSFSRYTTGLLWHVLVQSPKVFSPNQFRAVFKLSQTDRWDEWMYAATSFLIRGGYLLPDSVAFELAGRLPKSKRGVVVRRVGDELKNLFRTRYNERFGKGLALRVGKREHKFDYRPASAALGPASVVAASPMDVPSQFAPPCELWNECVDDLRRQSTIAGHGTELMAI